MSNTPQRKTKQVSKKLVNQPRAEPMEVDENLPALYTPSGGGGGGPSSSVTIVGPVNSSGLLRCAFEGGTDPAQGVRIVGNTGESATFKGSADGNALNVNLAVGANTTFTTVSPNGLIPSSMNVFVRGSDVALGGSGSGGGMLVPYGGQTYTNSRHMDPNPANWWSTFSDFMLGMLMNGEQPNGWGWQWGMTQVTGAGMAIPCEAPGGMSGLDLTYLPPLPAPRGEYYLICEDVGGISAGNKFYPYVMVVDIYCLGHAAMDGTTGGDYWAGCSNAMVEDLRAMVNLTMLGNLQPIRLYWGAEPQSPLKQLPSGRAQQVFTHEERVAAFRKRRFLQELIVERQSGSEVIKVIDRPEWSASLPGLLSSTDAANDIISEGGAVSEVGFAEMRPLLGKKFPMWELRKSRIGRMPSHRFGKMFISEAFSIPVRIPFTLPPAGGNISLNPVTSTWQHVMMDWYRGYAADVSWVIHVPEPLGSAHLLYAYAPEISAATETRGFRWKTVSSPTQAFFLGWSNVQPLKIKQTADDTSVGFPGGTLVIKTIESNTSSSVVLPIQAVAWCYVHNIRLSGLLTQPERSADEDFNFNPQPPQAALGIPEITIELQSDNPGSIAEGTQEGTAPDAVPEASTADLVTGPVESMDTSQAKQPDPKTRPQLTTPNRRWYKWQTVTLTPDNRTGTMFFDPRTQAVTGDSMGNPFRRNLWMSGGRRLGYAAGIEIKVVSSRQPTVAGCIAFYNAIDLNTGPFHLGYHSLGQDPTTLFLQFTPFFGAGGTYRELNNPWIRTSTANPFSLTWDTLAFNDAGDSTTSFTVFWRPGECVFQNPVKPRAKAGSTFEVQQAMSKATKDTPMSLSYLLDLGSSLLEATSVEHQMMSDAEATSSGTAQGPAPTGNDAPYGGLAANAPGWLCRQVEDLDQDAYWTKLVDLNLEPGKVISVRLPIWASTDFQQKQNADGVIRQKWQRFAEAIPEGKGHYGPTVGQYNIVVRLPATATAQLRTVCLPGDLNDIVTECENDLTDISELPGVSHHSIGGTQATGAIGLTPSNPIPVDESSSGDAPSDDSWWDTVASMLPSLGGLALSAAGVGAPVSAVITALMPLVMNAMKSGALPIAGMIPLSRFYESLRGVAGFKNSMLIENTPTLLMKLDQTMGLAPLGRSTVAVPASIYVMQNKVAWNRAVYERDVPVDDNIDPPLFLTLAQAGNVLVSAGNSASREGLVTGAKLLTRISKAIAEVEKTSGESQVIGTYVDATALWEERLPTAAEVDQCRQFIVNTRRLRVLV
jgi:hypothetical protein